MTQHMARPDAVCTHRSGPAKWSLETVLAEQREAWDACHLAAQRDMFCEEYGEGEAGLHCLAFAATMWEHARNEARWIMLHGERAGLYVLQNVQGVGFLLDMLVVPGAQGQGLGRAVMTSLKEQAESAGQPLLLEVFPTNTRAKAFYERQGFQTVGVRPPHHVQMLYGTL